MILEGLYLLLGCHKHKGHIRDGATQCGHLQTELQSTADKGRNKGQSNRACPEGAVAPAYDASTPGPWPEHQLSAKLT